MEYEINNLIYFNKRKKLQKLIKKKNIFLNLCLKNEKSLIKNLLINYFDILEIKNDILFHLYENGNKEIFKQIIKYFYKNYNEKEYIKKLKKVNTNNLNIFMLAVHDNNIPYIKILLKYNIYEKKILHIIIQKGNFDCFKIVIKYFINNLIDFNFKKIFYYSCLINKNKFIIFLLKKIPFLYNFNHNFYNDNDLLTILLNNFNFEIIQILKQYKFFNYISYLNKLKIIKLQNPYLDYLFF